MHSGVELALPADRASLAIGPAAEPPRSASEQQCQAGGSTTWEVPYIRWSC